MGNRSNPFYLALVIDTYSKKIVWYNLSNSLSVEGFLDALEMALKTRNNNDLPLIHHSDRGLQYCSNEYQKLLKENNVKTSMTEQHDPYENAVVERINGIFKQEFGVARPLKNLNEKSKLMEQSVQIYNQERPHLSNNMLTPNQMHEQSKVKMKNYKSKIPCIGTEARN